jgi:glycosyltransferase involved in cell wall biosynthesis
MTGAPLTILQLTHHGEGAGSTQSIASLSQYLAARGHRVLVGCRAGTVLERLAAAARLETVPLEFDDGRALAARLRRLINERRIDVVNAHDTRDRRALARLRWRRQLPQAFVVTRRTMPLTSPLELLAIGLTADRTIAVSESVAAALRRRLYPGKRIRVVPNGVDLARIDSRVADGDVAWARGAVWNGGSPDGRPVILIAARRKRQDVVLRALSLLQRPAIVACVGTRPDPELAGLAAAVPVRHSVVFVPFTERLLPFYQVATIVALPSMIEGLSQALLEAMALGLPVVASAAGGNRDLVTSGATGLLVPTTSVKGWAEAFERLLGDTALAGRLAQAGRVLVRSEFTMDRTVDRTVAVYREALARRLPHGESRD